MSLDQYLKISVIGRGSYGEVWQVKHKKDRKQYVLKKLDLQNASKRERKAAEQEAKLLSRLKHPNIVSYKDSFEGGDGYLYIGMGFCEGGDLYARLKEQKGQPLDEKQVVEWFVQIAMALQYMHERNILHRDLKTQNIFLTKSKIIKVGDLGIARVLDSSSDMATTLIGTPYYMSPELFSNKPYNHKSDVWALGCCVYEMITLKHAFNAKDMNALVYKILRGKSPQMPKMYSPELISLIKAMMNHNAEKRPSVNRILRDPYIKKNIAVFLDGTKKTRRPSTSSRPGSSESRRSNRGSIDDDRDGAESVRSSASSVSSVAGMNREYNRQAAERVEARLEPLNDGPDLAPISEEQAPRDLVDGNRKAPAPRPSQPRNPPVFQAPLVGEAAQIGGRKKKRNYLAEVAQQQNLPNSASAKAEGRPLPAHKPRTRVPSAKTNNAADKLTVDSKPPRADSPGSDPKNNPPYSRRNKSPRNRSDSSPSGRSSGARSPSGHSSGGRSPRNKSSIVSRSQSPKSSSGGSTGGSISGSRKSERDNHRPMAKPRPLPSKPGPVLKSSEPQKSKSAKVGNRDRESGYGSSSSATNSRNDDLPEDTPRASALSARERRREQKERETPRTARSVDITPRPIAIVDPSSRPSTADSSSRRAARGPPVYDAVDAPIQRSKKVPSPVFERPIQGHKRQPSIGKEEVSSSSSSGEECDDGVAKKENKRNDKEMKNFISLLDTTLRLNKDDDKSDSDDDIVIPSKVSAPGSTTYIRRSSGKKPTAGGDTEAQEVKEPKETEQPKPSPINPNMNLQEYLNMSYSPAGGSPGKTMTTTGRLWERITMLRKDCIRGLGVEKLKRAYDILDQYEADELEPQLVTLLGKVEFDTYAGKIWQLKFCEEAAFGLI